MSRVGLKKIQPNPRGPGWIELDLWVGQFLFLLLLLLLLLLLNCTLEHHHKIRANL